ncbi:MAG: glycosyltransferase family 9 protein, partial [Candidatus Scalindua sp.]
KPDFALAHVNISFVLLLTENFKQGWQEYEWRLRIKGRTPKTLLKPLWDGSSLNGKSILVYTEQGFGDSIQFVRYLPMVKAQNGRVIVECQQSLCRLLKNCDGIDEIIEKTHNDEAPMQIDVHVPLLSLAGIFDVNMDSISSYVPYIKPDPVLVSEWNTILDHDSNFKVGIVWASDPKNKNIYHKKSCKLNDFESISGIPGLSFYSLQKGPASAEVHNSPKGMKIISLDNELNDFADTAAVIANLDLVISVDTAVAHLTGAIGKPVWTLLPFASDWRWLLKHKDSPWYPSMRLFRQYQPGDWGGVFDKVKQALISNFGVRNAEHKKKYLSRQNVN